MTTDWTPLALAQEAKRLLVEAKPAGIAQATLRLRQLEELLRANLTQGETAKTRPAVLRRELEEALALARNGAELAGGMLQLSGYGDPTGQMTSLVWSG